MLKKLLLTAALLSSTYGATTEYVDPDFSLLANRSAALVVNETGATINLDKSESWVLRRLTQAEVTEVLNSTDIDVLNNAMKGYTDDMWSVRIINTDLTSDTTPGNGISKAMDYEFLRQLFWSRVSLIEQIVQRMLLSPHIMTDDPTGILKKQQKKIAAFSARHDHSDITPFSKGHSEDLSQLMIEFGEIYDIQ